jgi:hypothetical protein
MRLKNSSGGVIFDTTNRYIKTTSPGSINLAAVSPAPFPDGASTLADGSGFLYFLGSMQAKTVDTTLNLSTVSNPGYLQFRTYMMSWAGGGIGPVDYARQGTLAQVKKNGVHLLNVEHWSGRLFPGNQGPQATSGILHNYQITDTSSNIITSPHTISVAPDDVISFVYKWYLTLDPLTYVNIADFTIFYYSDSDALPLEVTA